MIGLFEHWECAIGEYHLYPGDTLVLYTDGVIESPNHAGEEFGEELLVEALRQHRDLSKELLAAVTRQVQQFCPYEQADDITLIVAKSR